MAPHEEAQTNAPEPINTRGLRAVLIFGAAHYVCKTLVATALCREIEGRRAQRTLYLQPASGRPPDASDTRCEFGYPLNCGSWKLELTLSLRSRY
jgi:hypothetical protein